MGRKIIYFIIGVLILLFLFSLDFGLIKISTLSSTTAATDEPIATSDEPTLSLSIDPFIEANGIVVIECEHYNNKMPGDLHEWELNTDHKGYSGEGAMEVSPNNDFSWMSNYAETSPELFYKVVFKTTGRYYIWLRGYGADDHSDSVHIGLDGNAVQSSKALALTIGQYGWLNKTYDWDRSYIDIPKTGLHEINLWAREDGSIIDKIILATNPDYTPDSSGR